MANQIGKWAFIVGAVLAIILGIVEGSGTNIDSGLNIWLMALLVLAGLIVGIVNITAKEVQGFLIASIAVLLANTASLDKLFPGMEQVGGILAAIVTRLVFVIAPAALIVGLRAVYGFAAE